MGTKIIDDTGGLIISEMAENLIGSEIIKLAHEVNEKIRQGEHIYNLTIGDFNPELFPIPTELKEEIIKAYSNNQTNYPTANGMVELRKAVSQFLFSRGSLAYREDQILIAGGGRPLIYAIYNAILDPGDSVLFPVPSWNNNHYSHLTRARQIPVSTTVENNFMPTAGDLKPHIKTANLIALCSPLNPTGTTFSKEGLEEICDLILEENHRRGPDEKPVYLLFDQIYWLLTYGDTQHYHPVTLRPEIREYAIFIDGMSKAFAATGVRIGWGFGPLKIIGKMKSIIGHIGAWSPKAAQVAAANYLMQEENVDRFIEEIRSRIQKRLQAFYDGFKTLKSMGHNVDAIAPQAAMYLTVKIDLRGHQTEQGKKIETTEDVTQFLLNDAKIALVPFYAFGAERSSSWYRLSVGTTSMQDVDSFFESLRNALSKLS